MGIEQESIETSQWQWDDVVDVICAGAGPGALAHAVWCVDSDLDVEYADAELYTQPTDPDTAAYLQSMTDDLDPEAAQDLELPIVRAEPVTVSKDRRATIEPFFGSRLRDWSGRCVASSFGVIYSQIPESMTAMRSRAGETIQAAVLGDFQPATDRPARELTEWLQEQARERDLLTEPGMSLQRLVFEDGRVAGAVLATPEGMRLVRANLGVALSTGPTPGGGDWPAQHRLPTGAAQVAMVSRTASRFGRVELMYGC